MHTFNSHCIRNYTIQPNNLQSITETLCPLSDYHTCCLSSISLHTVQCISEQYIIHSVTQIAIRQRFTKNECFAPFFFAPKRWHHMWFKREPERVEVKNKTYTKNGNVVPIMLTMLNKLYFYFTLYLIFYWSIL